jgi:hypothetical protein
VIRAEITEGGIILEGTAAPGMFAYVDRDWLPAVSGEVPSLTVSADGTLAWGEVAQAGPGAADPDTVAASVLLSVARDAANAVADLPPGSVEVIGDGLIAHLVRALVGEDASGKAESPMAIVDTTGDPASIVDATRRVGDLGTVVLVGETVGREVELNLYADVHMRGLTLQGISPPLEHGRQLSGRSDDDALHARCQVLLGRVRSGTVVPAGAAWYAVTL